MMNKKKQKTANNLEVTQLGKHADGIIWESL